MSEPPPWFLAALATPGERAEVTLAGCLIHYRAWGPRGRPVLALVHGAAAHSGWWSFLAPQLAQQGWRVVAPDLSGHGDSGWREDGYCLERWAEEVHGVVAAAAGEAADVPPVAVGHSLGAQVVAVAAARAAPGAGRRPFGRVVLCDTTARPPGSTGRTARRLANRLSYTTRQDALDRFALIPHQPCANDWILAHLAEESVRQRDDGRWIWKSDWRLFARTSQRTLAEDLAAITVPVAFLHGACSALVSQEAAERTRQLTRPPAPVAWVANAGHHLWLDQPLAFLAALQNMLGSAGC